MRWRCAVSKDGRIGDWWWRGSAWFGVVRAAHRRPSQHRADHAPVGGRRVGSRKETRGADSQTGIRKGGGKAGSGPAARRKAARRQAGAARRGCCAGRQRREAGRVRGRAPSSGEAGSGEAVSAARRRAEGFNCVGRHVLGLLALDVHLLEGGRARGYQKRAGVGVSGVCVCVCVHVLGTARLSSRVGRHVLWLILGAAFHFAHQAPFFFCASARFFCASARFGRTQ